MIVKALDSLHHPVISLQGCGRVPGWELSGMMFSHICIKTQLQLWWTWGCVEVRLVFDNTSIP